MSLRKHESATQWPRYIQWLISTIHWLMFSSSDDTMLDTWHFISLEACPGIQNWFGQNIATLTPIVVLVSYALPLDRPRAHRVCGLLPRPTTPAPYALAATPPTAKAMPVIHLEPPVESMRAAVPAAIETATAKPASHADTIAAVVPSPTVAITTGL